MEPFYPSLNTYDLIDVQSSMVFGDIMTNVFRL